jgi:hypothetical protein
MCCIDILSFFLLDLGVYGLTLKFRLLLPRNIIPLLSTLLNETRQLLDRAEEIGAVPPQSEWRTDIDRYDDLRARQPRHPLMFLTYLPVG